MGRQRNLGKTQNVAGSTIKTGITTLSSPTERGIAGDLAALTVKRFHEAI